MEQIRHDAYGPTSFSDLHSWAAQSIKLSGYNLRTDEGREGYAKAFDALRAGYVGANANIIQSALIKIRDRVIDEARHAPGPREMLRYVKIAVEQNRNVFMEAIRKVYVRIFLAYAPRIIEQFRPKALKGPGRSSQDLTESERARFTNMARNYVRRQGGVLIVEPHRTTKRLMIDATREAVNKGFEEGWGTDRTAEEIRKLSTPAISKVRGRRISRTETLRASNAGSYETAQSLNTKLWKDWVSILDSRTRDTHVEADAQRVLLNEMFNLGGYSARYPNDPNLPARESVNCRCVIAFEQARQGATTTASASVFHSSHRRDETHDYSSHPPRTAKRRARVCSCSSTETANNRRRRRRVLHGGH